MDKVLITGASGMLGTTLQEVFKENSIPFTATDTDTLDITKITSIENFLDSNDFGFLINCGAYTNVEKAESEDDLCNKINAEAPGLLAKACKDRKIKFIHISTDYVFGDNSEDGYTEDDIPEYDSPNVYGRSKRLGELSVLANNHYAYIVRVSWTFGKGGKNFIDTMIWLAKEKEEVTIVRDEFGVPTSTLDIARSLVHMVKNIADLKPGIYHAVSEGYCSRLEEAKKIFELIKSDIKVYETTISEYPRIAKIPNYSILINTKLPRLQNWEDSIEEYIKSLNNAD